MHQDLGTLPTSAEERDMMIWVKGSLWNPLGHFEMRRMSVEVTDLSDSAPLKSGDSISFSTELRG